MKLPPGLWPEGSVDRKLRSFSRYGVVVVDVVVVDDVLSVVDGAMVESVAVSAGGAIEVSLDMLLSVDEVVVLSVVDVLWPHAATLNKHAAAAAAITVFNIGGLLKCP